MVTLMGLTIELVGGYIIMKGTKQNSLRREGLMLLLGSAVIIAGIAIMMFNVSLKYGNS